MQNQKNQNGLEKSAAENYVSGGVCRGEQQYTLYLNNILTAVGTGAIVAMDAEEILDACGLGVGAKIEKVFYEAAFMRDFFERDRRDGRLAFNRTLLRYVLDHARAWGRSLPRLSGADIERILDFGNEKYKIKTLNLGGYAAQIQFDALKKNLNMGELDLLVRVMMNSKPDIAVVFRRNGRDCIKFIECKFLSSETSKARIRQSQCQSWAASFLCDEIFNDVSVEGPDNPVSSPVRFLRDDSEDEFERLKPGERPILIPWLLRLERKIFRGLFPR